MSQDVFTWNIKLAALIGAHDGVEKTLWPVQVTHLFQSGAVVLTIGTDEIPFGTLVLFVFAYGVFGESFSTSLASGGLFLASLEVAPEASQLTYPPTPTTFVGALHLELVDALRHAHVPERRDVPRRTERASTVCVELLLQAVAAVVAAATLGLVRIP